MSGLVLFFGFFGLVLIGMPIGAALGVASLFVMTFLPGTPSDILLLKSAVMGGNNFPLVAVPMFILAGDIMQSGGLSRRIVGMAARGVGHLRAGLAYVNVLASMFFAAISGSSPATVAAIGSNMIPEMEKRGYPRDFSAGLTAATGMLGVMIPPSIPFIIYGVTSSQSIGKLFMAGLIPGLLFGAAYIIVARYVLRDRDDLVSTKEELAKERAENKDGNAIWALLVPIIILGGIYGGIFTPTEAAGVAVIYALVISLFVYKELSFNELPKILAQSSLTAATCLVMVVMAFVFGRLLTMEQIPNQVAELITSFSDNKLVIILLLNLVLLAVGMFMETVAAIIILTPILLPVAMAVGVDPIHFGVILTVNLAIGFCTPPLGVNLFVASSVANISIERVFKALAPFFIAMLICLTLVSYVPQISLLLPNLFG
ncbi:TRAP transporter large permease [Rhodobacteraceae bacterium RKSG542]|uniref:TRAP transporter large permease n=1 Tax=Pseudovibrio flavus TaxID=2529854 RepID=UPI0012BC5E42|nr:TRAP transporter large permease [Pseudovibrio flavus]MTI17419.1 TRAP transporter large permease [Pseudovibrio flavus]